VTETARTFDVRWIEVSKGLPEYGQVVLVCDKAGEMVTAYRNHTDEDGEHWYIATESAVDESEFLDVTHWLTLPDPPQQTPV
jgi:Protein of unknown function (DUF551)